MNPITQARANPSSHRGHGCRPQCLPTRLFAGRWVCCQAVVVVLIAASTGWAQTAEFLGKVVALPSGVADVISPATGQMMAAREKPFTVGDRVKKGVPLVVFTNRYDLHDASHISTVRWESLQQMIEARYAALEARIAREKAERLKGLGTVSGQQLAELKAAEQVAEAGYLQRKSLLDQQDEQIKGTTLERRGLMAPIDGQISLANFTQSQMVYEGFLLYRIVDLKEIAVSARVPELSFQLWPQGTAAQIRFDDLPGKEFTGRLEVILPAVDPLSRTREVLFRVENPEELLRIGMIGRVAIKQP